jgi:hypothetical protein
MSFMTLYVLFTEDFRILLVPKDIDDVFMFFNCFAFALFAIDLFMSSIGIKGYFLGFYFWLDLVAVISLITDISWIWYRIIGIDRDISVFVDASGKFDP